MKRKGLWRWVVIGGVSLIVMCGGLYTYFLHQYYISPQLNCFITDEPSPTVIATPSENSNPNLQIEEIGHFQFSSKPILYLAYNYDGSQLAVATNERVWVLNTNTAKPTELKDSQMKVIWGLAFSPINNQLAVFGDYVSVWNTKTYQIIKRIDKDIGIVSSIIFTAGATQLVLSNTVSQDNSSVRQLQIWDTKNYSKEISIEYPHLVNYFIITPFGNCAVVKQRMGGNSDGYKMALVDLSTGGWRLFAEQDEDIYQVQISYDGETTASFTRTGLSLWNTRSGQRITKSIDSHAYNGVFYEYDRYLIILDAIPNNNVFKESIRLIEVASGQEITSVRRAKPDLTNIVIHPNGKDFATSTDDGQVIIWDIH